MKYSSIVIFFYVNVTETRHTVLFSKSEGDCQTTINLIMSFLHIFRNKAHSYKLFDMKLFFRKEAYIHKLVMTKDNDPWSLYFFSRNLESVIGFQNIFFWKLWPWTFKVVILCQSQLPYFFVTTNYFRISITTNIPRNSKLSIAACLQNL